MLGHAINNFGRRWQWQRQCYKMTIVSLIEQTSTIMSLPFDVYGHDSPTIDFSVLEFGIGEIRNSGSRCPKN